MGYAHYGDLESQQSILNLMSSDARELSIKLIAAQLLL